MRWRDRRHRAAPAQQWLALSALLSAVGAAGEVSGFLVISAPRNAKVSWVRLPENGDYAGLRPETLVDEGLRHPQGIAIDGKRAQLYVTDPDVQKIFAYQLVADDDVLRTDGRQQVLVSGVESRWVAVDGSGNVFFSDEPYNRILKVPADQALRGAPPAEPVVVYSGADLAEVNEPGGVAVDNFHVFWTNKHFGTQVGALVRGSEMGNDDSAHAPVAALAKNSVKCFGVCIAMGNVFFTDSDKSLYGVKKNGGPVEVVASGLSKPRGCAWDGDGTVYVADRGTGSVYSFASNMHVIARAEMKKAFDVEDAFGVAVFPSPPRRWWKGLLGGVLSMVES